MPKQKRKSPNCLNCKQQLSETDNFCHQCGQENTDKKIPLINLIRDFFGDYFSFDSKLFKSIIPLLFKPGLLTIEFNAGKRVKYIPPLRMYIFISFIYFFLQSLNIPTRNFQYDGSEIKSETTTNKNFNLETDSSVEITLDIVNNALDSLDIKKTAFREFMTNAFVHQINKLIKNDESFRDYLLKNVSVMMFLFLPAFAFLLKIIYWRSGKYYMEHLVFIFHYHSFLFLFFTLIHLLQILPDFLGWGIAIIFILAVAWIFFYLIKAMRAVYQQSATKTVLKFLILLAGYLFTSIFFIVATLIISFLLF